MADHWWLFVLIAIVVALAYADPVGAIAAGICLLILSHLMGRPPFA